MTFKPTRITLVANTAVELTARAETDTREGRNLAVLGCDVDVYLGDTNAVTTSTGAKLAAGVPLSVDLASGERVWAVAGGAGTLHMIETGV
jgi:hypothetical protein